MDELVKQCRDCIDCLCGDCKYEHLQKPGNFVPCMNALLGEAADAIEELQATVEGYESSTNMALVEKNGKTVIEFVPKWIPVAERLPEQGKRYLVIRFDEVTKTQFIDILWHDAHDLWWNRLYKGQYNVTHWMELPPAPKEEV